MQTNKNVLLVRTFKVFYLFFHLIKYRFNSCYLCVNDLELVHRESDM